MVISDYTSFPLYFDLYLQIYLFNAVVLPLIVYLSFYFTSRPHFKPLSEILEDSDSSPNTPVKKFINSRFRRESSDSAKLQSSPRLYRSFSTQPTSKFRVNPYPTNGVCVNSQTFLSSLTSSFARVPDALSSSQKFSTNVSVDGPKSAWTNSQVDNSNASQSLLRSQNITNSPGFASSPKLPSRLNDQREVGSASSFHEQSSANVVGLGNGPNPSISLNQTHAASPASNRLPPTGPSSAVFQLNFPILKSKSPGTPSKGHLNRRLSSSNDNSKDHRNAHKRNNATIPLKNGVPNVPQAHFRQAISTMGNTNQQLNVTR